MTLYRITHAAGQLRVTAIDGYGMLPPRTLTPDRAASLREACDTGFACGYLGAGSHTLALALLLDATRSEHAALSLYEEFTLAYVVEWPQGRDSEISSDEIEIWAAIQLTRGDAA